MPAADNKFGSFSESGPWILPEDPPEWINGLGEERERLRTEYNSILAAGKIRAFLRLAQLIVRVGPPLAIWFFIDKKKPKTVARSLLARRLRKAFQKLGPTYIKLGQIISSGEGIFPQEIVSEFRLLRDRVPPESFHTIQKVIKEELLQSPKNIFSFINSAPIAAASIAQVHIARLKTGEEVALKVRRPKLESLVRNDLSVMETVAPYLVGRIPIAALANPPALVELFAETVLEELDFRLEAENMLDIAKALAKSEHRAIIVPRPHPVFVTKRLLVMEKLEGFYFEEGEKMRSAGIDTEKVLHEGVLSFLEGVMLHGVFHGDLHGGNLFVQKDGRIALLDFGITGRLDQVKRQAFLRLIISATINNVTNQVIALQDLGAFRSDISTEQIIKDLRLDEPAQDVTEMSAKELTAQLKELTKQLLDYGAHIPKELMLFVKNMLFLDSAVGNLAPEIDIFQEFTSIAMYFATHHSGYIAEQTGIIMQKDAITAEGLKSSLGLSQDIEKLTYKDIQQRREIMRKKFQSKTEQ
ncbi:MAG: AarF/UbiB family protein [Firmicutes bacterium]|nr:AarF/UbiB family protein [Bacillota bacterium]